MIIYNGDHAEFEAEWEGRDPKERPDWPLPSFDARDWADAFCKLNPNTDHGLMVAWFANALMRGYDEGRAALGQGGGMSCPDTMPCERLTNMAKAHAEAAARIRELEARERKIGEVLTQTWKKPEDRIIEALNIIEDRAALGQGGEG